MALEASWMSKCQVMAYDFFSVKRKASLLHSLGFALLEVLTLNEWWGQAWCGPTQWHIASRSLLEMNNVISQRVEYLLIFDGPRWTRSTVRLGTLCNLIKGRNFQWRKGWCLGWLLKMSSSSICDCPCLVCVSLLGITCVSVCFKCRGVFEVASFVSAAELQNWNHRHLTVGELLVLPVIEGCRGIKKSRQKLV